MRIRHRLLLGFMAVVAIFIVFGGYVYLVWQSMNEDMQTLDQLFETTTANSFHELDTTLHLGLALEASRGALLEFLLGDSQALGKLNAKLDEFDLHYDELSASVAAGVDSRSDQETLAALAAIEEQHEHFEEEASAIASTATRGNEAAAAQIWRERVADEFDAINADLGIIEERIEGRTETAGSAFDEVIHAVEARIRNLQNVMIAVLGLAILIAFAIGFFTAQTISRPIEQLSEAAMAIEEGTFKPAGIAAVTARKDELGHFARIFEHMAEQIYRREQQLRAHISALRIEIDRQKSTEQVAKITETDFFRDLQAKARAMRADSAPSDL